MPPALEAIVHRCLAKDRDDRYESAGALRAELRAALVECVRDGDRMATPITLPLPPRELDPPSDSQMRVSFAPESVAPGTGRERRRVGIVYFRSPVDVITVQRRLLSLGAELAYASGNHFAAVYSHEVGDNLARRALRAGRELVKLGVCGRALVDLAPVSVQVRPDGGRRFWSPLFAREDRFGEAGDPGGVFATSDAAATIPELARGALTAQGWVSAEGILTGGRADTQSLGLEGRPFVGRDEVLAALLRSARRTVARGHPATAVVLAEAGLGKSHLGQVLLDRLGTIDLRAEIIDLRARPPDFGDADRTLRELLQRALGLPVTPAPEAARADRAPPRPREQPRRRRDPRALAQVDRRGRARAARPGRGPGRAPPGDGDDGGRGAAAAGAARADLRGPRRRAPRRRDDARGAGVRHAGRGRGADLGLRARPLDVRRGAPSWGDRAASREGTGSGRSTPGAPSSSAASCSCPRRACRSPRSPSSWRGRRRCRSCWWSWCAGSSARASCAATRAASRGTWRPTSSVRSRISR